MSRAQYEPVARAAARRYGIDEDFFLTLLDIESGFQPNVTSPVGAQGIAQFMPATFAGVLAQHPELLRLPIGGERSPYNAQLAIYASAAHLGDLLRHAGGDYAQAAAGYYAGSGVIGTPVGQMTPEVQHYVGLFSSRIPWIGGGGGAPSGDGGGGLDRGLDDDDPYNLYYTDADRIADAEAALGRKLTDAEKRAILGLPMSEAEALRVLGYFEQQQQRALAEGRQDAALAFERAMAQIQFSHDLSQAAAREDRQFQQRENRLRSAEQLIDRLAQMQLAAGESALSARERAIQEIGRSPFRGAVQARGSFQLGQDPHTALRGQLRSYADQLTEFGSQPIPTVAPDATTSDIEDVIARIRERIQGFPTRPQTQTPFGLAEGGVMDMVKGGDGAFTLSDDDSFAVLVGEGHNGEGLSMGTAEVLTVRPDGRVEVTPLRGRAQAGFTIQPTGQSSQDILEQIAQGTQGGGNAIQAAVNAQSQAGIIPASQSQALGAVAPLAPLFNAIGATAIPIGRRIPSAYGGMFESPLFGTGVGLPTGPHQPFAGETFRALGTTPRLIYDPNHGAFFIVDNNDQIRIIGDGQRLQSMGLNASEAVIMPVEELMPKGSLFDLPQGQFSAMAPNPYFTHAEAGLTPELTNPRGTFASPASPIFSPLNEDEDLGVFLPDPRLLAGVWRTLPSEVQDLARDAYSFAGINDLDERLDFFSLRGTAGAGATRFG